MRWAHNCANAYKAHSKCAFVADLLHHPAPTPRGFQLESATRGSAINVLQVGKRIISGKLSLEGHCKLLCCR